MMKAFIERENEIFEMLEEFYKSGLPYVLIGGYAVSAHMHRFSVDADICVRKGDVKIIKKLLESNQFFFVKRKELEDLYKGEFECYVKKTGLPVTVDLLINSVASRQTNVSFSFEQLYENSHLKKIVGIEKTIDARIPVKELLIALKIHSARLTDIRDIVGLCHGINIEKTIRFVTMKKSKQLSLNVHKILEVIESNNFKDSFKGIFSLEKLPADNMKNAVELMKALKGKV